MTNEQPPANGLRAVETMRAFLAGTKELTSQEVPFDGGVAFHIQLEGPTPEAIARVFADTERFVIQFVFEDRVAPPRRFAVAELITRANFGLAVGNFELDLDSGLLRYKTGIDFSATPLTDLLIRNSLLSPMETIEDFAEAMFKVMDGEMEADEAYRLALATAAP
jgi:hypothetical protein